MKLIVIDTETGGLDADEHSALSLAATVYPPEPANMLHVKIRERPYSVTSEALAVNKIDLVEHDKEAVEPSAAWAAFLAFVAGNRDAYRVAGRLVLAGHNTPFDLRFLRRLHRLSGDSVAFDDYVSHRYVDTMAAGTFLILADKLPGRQPMGLAALLKEHGIVNGAAHTALGDAVATSRLLEAMVGRMKGAA